ncbi:MAG: ATP-binding cassette domain-containing protein [Actinomycetia bacterium]|nr:ATP-binding cassette domain-containing protein [Actinomycetes bacterium]
MLRLEHVTKHFGELAAVNDLSFELEEGEVFGIAGPNGAGKTTVFNLISGFLHGSGRIYFDGRRIDGLQPHQITHLGVARTFQIPQPFNSMTVVQNLRIGEYYGVAGRSGPKKDAPWNDLAELISFVGLEGKEARPVSTLKLYDKKLTVLASALATKPRLIMLDEALGGLSAVEAEQSLELLQRLNREWGLTIIMIEHLMSALTRSCDRLLILNNGEALRIGEPRTVVEDPVVIECLVGVKHA